MAHPDPLLRTRQSARALDRARAWSLGAAATAMGLIAGFFYAYASSVMIGLRHVDDRTFITAMQWINATVRNQWFAPSFFGALLLTALAFALHLRRDGRRPLPWILAAFVLYLTAFAITMGVNVPLNETLAEAGDPSVIADLAAVRSAFEGPWVTWNTVRTLAATGALVCLIRALVVQGRSFGDGRRNQSAPPM